MKIDSLLFTSLQPRVQDLSARFRQPCFGKKRCGAVSSHPTGIQTAIIVEHALMILGGREEPDRLSITKRVKRNFGAFKEFLDHDLLPCGAEALSDHHFC